jgi:hypothetical protein
MGGEAQAVWTIAMPQPVYNLVCFHTCSCFAVQHGTTHGTMRTTPLLLDTVACI